MRRVRALSVFFSLLVLSNFAVAADLDVAGAKDRYERQRQIADLAKQRFDTQAQLLANAEQEVSNAAYYEQNAQSALQSEQSKLNQIDSNLSQLERDISNLQSYLDSNNSTLMTVNNQLTPLYTRQANLNRRIPEIGRRIDEVSQRISELEAQDPNSPQLANLRERKRNLERELNDAQSELNNVNYDVSRLERQRDNLNYEISNQQSQIRDKQLTLSQTQRERDRQLMAIQDARDEVRRAEQRTAEARRRADAIRPTYIASQNEYQREQQLAQSAYDYYMQVVANYNAALNAVYASADRAAGDHARREAQDRAPDKGKADGLAVGKSKGVDKGTADGNARDLAKGYADGREKAAIDAALSSFYLDGIEKGKAIAIAKGKAENLPKGYNDTLKAHFAADPAGAVTIDISENISSDPGGSGNMLALSQKSIGNVAGPAFNFLKEPTFAPPAYEVPGVSVPALIKAYYDPPCTGLVLAEFEPLCRQRYESSYKSSFDSSYQAVYRQNYQPAYESEAKSRYQLTLAGNFPASFTSGRQKGAAEQGSLDGFAKNQLAQQTEQYNAGIALFKVDVSKGSLIVFKEASLSETSGDGLFTPGEPVKLRIVVDNLGLEASALGKVRMRLTTLAGLGVANFTMRELPALAPHTRTTLEGVTAIPVTTEFPAEKMTLNAILEQEANGIWKNVSALAASAETRFPVELSEVILPKVPKVDEKLTATFRYVNRLRNEVDLTKVLLKSSPKFVDFPTTATGELGKLAPGESKDITLDIKPGVWTGENTYVKFVSATEISDTQKYNQAFAKFIHMDRSASVNIFLGNQPLPGSTLNVSAGSRVQINAQVAFHGKGFLPGPFELRVGKPSNPAITSTSNTTVGVNYGGMSPTTKPGVQPFYFEVPKSLAGKNEYVMITLSEGGVYRHVAMVYLNIK